MKSRKLEIWVGLFVVLSIAAFLMLALQVSGLSNFYGAKGGYTVKANFANIGGLKVRSRVTVSGVTIGRVESIVLEENSYGEYQAVVSFVIATDFNKLPADSSAKILTAGLLGDNYIGLVPGHSDKFLQEGSVIEFTSQAILLEDLISKFATGK